MYRERWEILEFFLHSGNGPSDPELAKNIARAIHANSPAALNMLLSIRNSGDNADVIKLVLGEIISQTDLRLIRKDAHPINTTLIHTWFQYVKPEFYNEKGAFIAQSDCAEYKTWGDIIFRQANCLHRALDARSYSFATFLMDIGNDENIQINTGNGKTPLHCCLRGMCRDDCSSCMSMVQRLLQFDSGKLANIPDNTGRLPAYSAMRRFYWKDVLRVVLDNTRNNEHKDNSGQSLLHQAIAAGCPQTLLEKGSVDLFSRNNTGQTTFSAPIYRGYGVDVEALEYLFEADPRLASAPDESEEEFTPLYHAMKHIETSNMDIGI